MKITARRAIFLAIFVFVIALSTAVAASVQEARLDASIRGSTATVQFITAMSGQQLQMLFAGKAVELSSLSAEGQAQILDAIELQMGPRGFREMIGDPPAGSKVVLTLDCEFGLAIQHPSFGERGNISIPLSEIASNNRVNASGTAQSAVQNPPSLDDIMGSAPEDKAEKAAWLKQRIVELIAPAGDYWLAQKSIPFELSDFAQARSFVMASLNQTETAWMKTQYDRYDLYVQVQRDKLKELGQLDASVGAQAAGSRANGEPVALSSSVAVGHVTADYPKYPLPEWPVLQDSTLRLYASFTPKVGIEGCTTCQIARVGWVVETLP